ncbi:MAG: hypothetical protein K6E29_09360 [Cyanobacteria bacterium RUI128]|nr:hypothetical protein [Cyanobacteria bacterium RUI128]
MKDIEFYQARYRDDLANSEVYELIKEQQIEMLLEYATTNIDEKEFKGMAKLIAKTGGWKKDYKKKLEIKKNEEKR